MDKVLQARVDTGAQAIHPGYGFLSAKTPIRRALRSAGPGLYRSHRRADGIVRLETPGARCRRARRVPLVPGSPLLQSIDAAVDWAANVGYPVMLKSTAGGGGIGMQVCAEPRRCAPPGTASGAWRELLRQRRRIPGKVHRQRPPYRSANLRRRPGKAIALGERDCSAQRRNQKVIEETPAPNLSESARRQLHRRQSA